MGYFDKLGKVLSGGAHRRSRLQVARIEVTRLARLHKDGARVHFKGKAEHMHF
jgi:hypothetical protein